MEQQVQNPTMEKMVMMVVVWQVLEMVVAKQEVNNTIEQHMTVVDNTKSGSDKVMLIHMSWQPKQPDLDNVASLNELHLHVLHVVLSRHIDDQRVVPFSGTVTVPYWKGPLRTESTTSLPFSLPLMYNSIRLAHELYCDLSSIGGRLSALATMTFFANDKLILNYLKCEMKLLDRLSD
ncbi:hypothetical protein Tco_0355345 [Tanacetum coccineum]